MGRKGFADYVNAEKAFPFRDLLQLKVPTFYKYTG
jgi:hypothetical protein